MSDERPVVYVVDDDPSYLEAVSRLLRAAGHRVEGFGSAARFLEALPAGATGCVLADLRMPGLSGLDLQDVLARRDRPLPVVFVSGEADVPSAARALKHGAEDFLTKLAPREELLEAVTRALARGAREREAHGLRRERLARYESLTERERQVLAHVLQGRLNKQIASRLSIHERTVKLHRTSLMSKLGVGSVAELTRWVQEAGLLADLDRLARDTPKGQ